MFLNLSIKFLIIKNFNSFKFQIKSKTECYYKNRKKYNIFHKIKKEKYEKK